MQIGLKTGVLVTLALLGSGLQAEENTAVNPDATDTIVSDRGQVEGYFSLSLAENSGIDATFIAAKTAETHGKVMLLHDSSGGIDSYGLMHVLRTRLPDYGWSTMTLALNYPDEPDIFLSSTAASDAEASADTGTNDEGQAAEEMPEESVNEDLPVTEDNNAARISAALTYLDAQQPGPLIVVAVGNAAPLAETVSQQLDEEGGLVWIAPAITPAEEPENRRILDIAVSTPVLAANRADERRVWMRQHQQKGYSQRSISGAGYGFYGFEDTVLTNVRGWLAKQFVNKDTP